MYLFVRCACWFVCRFGQLLLAVAPRHRFVDGVVRDGDVAQLLLFYQPGDVSCRRGALQHAQVLELAAGQHAVGAEIP